MSKYWLFTLNNPTISYEELEKLFGKECSYYIFQLEKGESGTPHYQGYCEFFAKKRLEALSNWKLLAHWERRMGTATDCERYCSKEDGRIDGPWTKGIISKGQGNRSDLDELKRSLDEGKNQLEIAELHWASWLRYRNSITSYLQLRNSGERKWKTKVTIIIGEPGTGKSKWCSENFEKAYWKDPENEFFCGYDGHETIILDDFYGWLRYATMLRLMDRYPLLLNVKGSKVQCLAKNLIITSNTEPETWYKEIFKRESALTAFMRRVDEIKYFNK